MTLGYFLGHKQNQNIFGDVMQWKETFLCLIVCQDENSFSTAYIFVHVTYILYVYFHNNNK